MTKILMDSGVEFAVTESMEVVMQTLSDSPRGQGRGPRRPGSDSPAWVTFTKEEDGIYVYLNVDHITSVTEEAGT